MLSIKYRPYTKVSGHRVHGWISNYGDSQWSIQSPTFKVDNFTTEVGEEKRILPLTEGYDFPLWKIKDLITELTELVEQMEAIEVLNKLDEEKK